MAKVNIPFLVSKTNKAGVTTWFWQPSATIKAAGWTSLPLGTNADAAMDAARAQNRKLAEWRSGGERPAAVRKLVRAATLGALWARYVAEGYPSVKNRGAPIELSTRGAYRSAWSHIEPWAGDLPLTAITPARVGVFRDALMRATGHANAHAVLRFLRTLFSFARQCDLFTGDNPAGSFGLATPPPRQQIWDEDGGTADVDAFAAAAAHIGYPDLGFAVDLAAYLGQREGDLIRLTESQWREVKNLDRETHDTLAGADGRVMGFFIRTSKTKRWVGIPVTGELRARVEARIAGNRARSAEPGAIVLPATILINDHNGGPWTQRRFIAKFTDAKAFAGAGFTGRDGAIHPPRPSLADLQFRDLRRTAVVRLGELGLEDQLIAALTAHQLGTVKKILETYMPRTTKMAARAIVARLADHRAMLDRKELRDAR